MKKGLMITFEGGEGSGKSSILRLLMAELAQKRSDILFTREPGGTAISEKIRQIILDRKNTMMDPKTEALLYCASRRQHLVETVFPALEAGKVVFSDRYLDSSLVYQGYARGIGIEDVLDINLFAIDKRLPDLTILFNIRPEVGLERIAKNQQREINRLDLEKLEFHQKVHDGYALLAERFKERFRLVDAEQDFGKVLQDVRKIVDQALELYDRRGA